LFYRTIRFRLTLWYVLTLAVILAASGFFWHLNLTRDQVRRTDHRLTLISEEVAAFRLKSQEGQPALPRQADGYCESLEGFLRDRGWMEYVQVISEQGELACFSSNLRKLSLPLSEQALKSARRGDSFFETRRDLKSFPIRILTRPLGVPGGSLVLVQVGASMALAEESLHDLRLMLMTFSPLALLIVLVGGWFLAGRALAPVMHITREVRKITADNLSQRLPVIKAEDEMGHLTETFNSMLARLETSFSKIKQFSGDASHELRTPLTILKGETEVAQRWAKTPDEFRKMLQSNLEEIDRMERIIENLLTLAKSEAGERPLKISEFSLSDLLQDLYLQGKTLGEDGGIDVILDMEVTREILMRGDQPQLQRLFLNLITNGIKYTPGGGRVEVGLTLREGQALVTVADNGIGIEAGHLPHIFDRFYRVDEARNREVGGTGLGLAIGKSIAEAHGGGISVRSTPGQGTVFTVRLPLAGPPAHA